MPNVLLTIAGALALMVPTAAYHYFAYRSKLDVKSLMTSVLVSQFVTAVVIMVLGMVGLFHGTVVLFLSSLISGYFGNRFADSESGKSVRKTVWITLGLFIVFTLAIQQVSPVVIEQDAYTRYLPWAKTMSQTHGIPGKVLPDGIGPYQLLFSPPVLHGTLATLFSAFGSYDDGLVASVPVFYSVMTLLLLLLWTEERNKRATAFVPVMLISSYAFLLHFHSLLQEVPLMLFVTIGLFFLLEFMENKRTEDMLLTALAFSLTTQVKYNGLIFSAIAFVVLVFYCRDWKQRWTALGIFALAHAPILFWFGRNFMEYNNPVYRMLYNYFPGKWNFMNTLQPVWPTDTMIPVSAYIKNFFIEFPALIFTLWYGIRNWKKKDFWLAFIFVIGFSLIMPLFRVRLLLRYMVPILGVLAIFAAIGFAGILSSFLDRLAKRRWRKIISDSLGVLSIVVVGAIVVGAMMTSAPVAKKKVYFDSQAEIADWLLENHRGAVLWGEGAPALTWYSRSFILTPDYNMFLAATGKPVVPYTMTFIRQEQVEKLEEAGQKLVIETLDAQDYNNIAHQLGVDYIFDSVLTSDDPGYEETNSLQMEPIYRAANANPELFTLVYEDSYGARLWGVN